MATIIGSIGRVVHELSAGLLDKQIPDKLSDAATSVVRAGFEVVGDVLRVVKESTAPDEPPTEENGEE